MRTPSIRRTLHSQQPRGILIGTITLLTLATTHLAAAPASAGPPPTYEVVRASPPQEFPPDTLTKDLPKAVDWGDNTAGALGNGTIITQLSPIEVTGGSILDPKEISSVDVGKSHTCAIAESDLYCWGSNASGQLGTGDDFTDHHTPTLVAGMLAGHQITAVSAGYKHTCAIADGTAYCWGSNSFGQLGNGTLVASSTPVKINANGALKDKAITSITAGYIHTCAIADGQAYCWGGDKEGQLGDGLATTYQSNPIAVNTVSGLGSQLVDAITAGDYHSCATAGGKAYCWGRNDHGQLGDNTHNNSSVPAPTISLPKVIAISAGGAATCAVTREEGSQQVVCWGSGSGGALGNGNIADSPPAPAKAKGKFLNTAVAAITMSASGGCALEQNHPYCWGNGDGSGKLGTGAQPISSTVPVPVDGTGVLSGRITVSLSTDVKRTAGIAVTTPKFTDVPPAQPFRSDINWLAGTGTAEGYPDGKYLPGANIARQAMAAFLFRYYNPGKIDPDCDPDKSRIYTDVHTLDLFCGAIEWLANSGINSAGGKFDPGQPIRRDTMATWLFRARHPGMEDLACTGGSFTRVFPDVGADNGNCGNVEWLARTGITAGYDDGTFKPGAFIARQAMAAFLRRLNALDSH